MKILYVEDNKVDAQAIQRELRQNAPHVQMDTVAGQKEAFERLERMVEEYELVLTDLQLPDGDGLTLLKHIRGLALPLAVVVVTGRGDEETAVTVLKAGADDYVVKRDDYVERLPLILESALHRYRADAIRRAHPLRVLYAEHNPTDIDLTRRHLKRYAPYIAIDAIHTASEVIAGLTSSNATAAYDVLLLDYRLPGMNALELLKELQQRYILDIPIVLVTGQGDADVATQALKLGASDYIAKNSGYLYQLPSVLSNAYHRIQLAHEQAALRESESRFRRLAGGVGHELRNPLGVISNAVYYLQGLLSDTDESAREYLTIIASEVGNADRIVSELIDASRIRQIEQVNVALSPLVEQILKEHSPPPHIQVEREIAPDLPELFVDAQHLEQVLRHLLLNAYQAMPQGGQLLISADSHVFPDALPTRPALRLRLSDSGCGIRRENMSRIFKPLFSTKTRGIGLGLTISQQMMDANGGMIQLSSREGQGTSVTLLFPVKEVTW